ncbi:MAG TPA: hypothetical protein VJT09_03455 [Pyrinomonadaceae bacterium]|nr:hypothetical protein [Pyrinomonadaceae bacterium]
MVTKNSSKTVTAAPSAFTFQYAVKFICTSNIPGTSQTGTSLPPGSYGTVVNIHNPNSRPVKFRMKVALSTATEVEPPQISDFLYKALGPDQATGVSCANLRDFGNQPIHGFEGFLVIESTHSFDVVAVYTAAGESGHVVSMDVEYIRERKLS